MSAIGVLADDLTGALGSAARLRAGGLEPVVVRRAEDLPREFRPRAAVVDMRTRDWLRHHPMSARPRKGFALVVLGADAERNGQIDELDAVVVTAEMPDWNVVAEGGKTVVVDSEHVAADLLARAQQLGLKCRGIVASGGVMASNLVDALGAQRLAVAAEVAPMCARGTLAGGGWAGLPVITQGGLDGRLQVLVNDLWRD